MTKKNFFDTLYKAAPINMHGLWMSVMLAQAALESGYGQSQLTKKYNNYFGILADSSWKGDKIKFSNGFTYRVYKNARESVADYVNFLVKNGRYKRAGVFDAATPEDEARALQNAGYAGKTTTYADKIISIINSQNLKEYDKKKRRRRGVIVLILGGLIVISFILKKS